MQTALGVPLLPPATAIPIPLEPALRYDPDEIDRQYRGRFRQVWQRQ